MRVKAKKLPIKVVAPAVTQAMMSHYKYHKPDDINFGTCYYWAYVANQFCGGKLALVWEYGGHAFLKIRNRYFDSTVPKGAKSINGLPFFKYAVAERVEKEIEILLPEKFKQKWKRGGAFGWSDSDVEEIVSIVKKNLEPANNAE